MMRRCLNEAMQASRYRRAFGKAVIRHPLLRRQLLSPRYIQHSARVLFVIGAAGDEERKQVLEAVFDLDRNQIRNERLLQSYDYIYDIAR